MPFLRIFQVVTLSILMVCCKSNKVQGELQPGNGDILAIRELPSIQSAPVIIKQRAPQVPDSTFVNLKDFSDDFAYDIKYATEENFLKSKVYDCAECFLRANTAEALLYANMDFISKGYRIKIFDCYRPLDIQKRMWKIVSNPSYVANPSTGSIHNRGGAVDITLVDKDGNELEMGTAFDHFGPEAAVKYKRLSAKVKANRKLLQDVMSRYGFTVLPSEWWHFNFKGASTAQLSNFKWDCP